MQCIPLFFRLFFIVCLSLLLNACSASLSLKQRRAMQAIENHVLMPSAAFLRKDTIYIHYEYEHKSFYLTASALPDHQKGGQYSLLSPKRVGNEKIDKAERIMLIGQAWGELVREVLLTQLPANPGEGRLVFIRNYETILYRRTDGTAALAELAKAPADITVVGRVNTEEFDELLFSAVKQRVKAAGVPYRCFLLRLDGIPLTPFLYVDTEQNLLTPLQLPPYYQLEKEMSSLGFSANFLWSFLVKSHLVGVLKAPFTSSLRLFSLAEVSVLNVWPHWYTDLNPVPPLQTSGDEMDIADFNKWLDKHITKQNYKASVQLLLDGEEFFPHFILQARQAKHSIFTRVYIFSADPYGVKIADLLKERSAQGIDVRVLTDELNTVLNSVKNPELNYSPGFVMPRNIKSYIRKKSRAKARTHLNTWATFDHTKVFLIDRELAYTGGMNIGEEYRYLWHDMMLALRGPVVGRLVKNFYEAWSFNGWGGDFSAIYRKLFSKKHRLNNKEEPGMIEVRLMYTKPTQAEIYHAQKEAMRRAKKRIYIQNAYLSDDRLVEELIQARGRGVDVRVILPGQNDVGIMDTNNRIMANRLWRNGVRVYFYQGMTHVKAALYDGWAVVGSANFDKMSLFVNQEMSLGIYDPAFVGELEQRLFEKDFAASEEMTQEVDVSWTAFLVDALTNQL